eukprot:jgi/Undpi1/12202/HiC_scaffold_5.g01878.m1
MDFVRRQRNQPGYDPNMHHILHGLDADLIMLGLATHERSFTILREEARSFFLVLFGRKQKEANEKRAMAASAARDALAGVGQKAKRGEHGEHDGDVSPNKPLQMLQLWVLREYLEHEFKELEAPGRVPFGYDFERVVDDFVFLCFFVGNDFLPHLPSLDIRDGAIDYLFNVYKRVISSLGDYLTANGGVVNLKQVDVIMSEVGDIEDEVFKRRKAADDKDQAKQKAKESDDAIKGLAVPIDSVKTDRLKDAKCRLEDGGKRGAGWGGGGDGEGTSAAAAEDANKSAAAKLREKLGGNAKRRKGKGRGKANAAAAAAEEEAGGGGEGGTQPPPTKVPRVESGGGEAVANGAAEKECGDENEGVDGTMAGEGEDYNPDAIDDDNDEEEAEEEEEDDPDVRGMTELEIITAKGVLKDKVKDQSQALLDKARDSVDDTVRLWEDGWKDRYYHDKCKLEDIEGGGGRERLFQTYVEGLCWVMLYYYQGCPSWTWYYPFHYAPFASDLINCDRFDMKFEESTPFRPMEQLMGVLPAASCKALPKPCRTLMTQPNSPIIDFYPKNVPCDPNGKPMPWLWVVLLPFIDEKRLLANLRPLYKRFTPEEKHRNSFGPSYLFAHVRTPLGKALAAFLSGKGAGWTGLISGGKGLKEGEMLLGSEEWDGFGGKIKLPSPGTSTPVGGTLEAPEKPVGVFSSVTNNQVAVSVYSMPPKGLHVCRMLSGVHALPRTLSERDLLSRRPPRLNRNMSIAEMGSTKYQAGGPRQSGGFPGQRMIQHQLGGSSGAYHGQSHGQGTPPPPRRYRCIYHLSNAAPPYYVKSRRQGYGYQHTGGYQRGYEEMHHMHQPTGNRRWGSQEPTPKRSGGRGGQGQGQGHQSRRNQQQPHQQHNQQQPQQYYHQAPPSQAAYYGQAPAAAPQAYYGQQPQPIFYQTQQQLQAPPHQQPQAVAPRAHYAAAPQQAPPQAVPGHTFQHPGYAAPAQQLPSAAGGYPTIDSLRSKLANALLQTKAPVAAAAPQGAYYAYPPQGAPAAQPYGVAPPAVAAGSIPPNPNQHIRFDGQGNPSWGGQPWAGQGAPPR